MAKVKRGRQFLMGTIEVLADGRFVGSMQEIGDRWVYRQGRQGGLMVSWHLEARTEAELILAVAYDLGRP